jgi:hypothetical protein
MTLFVISSQINDSAIERLKVEGFRMGVDLILEHRQKPDMSAALFQPYATTVLVSFIKKLRAYEHLAGKPAIS